MIIRPRCLPPRWDKVVKDGPLSCDLVLGNATQYKAHMFWSSKRLVVAIEGRGCYTFEHYAHWTYVQDKLDLLDGDAMNIADFINVQLGLKEAEQGEYMESCCQDVKQDEREV